jgi:AraC-like DNA-binding protein
MRVALLMIFFLAARLVTFSQDRALDSLYRALANHTAHDTTRLGIMFDICYRENTLHPEKSKLLAEEALGIAGKMNSIEGIKATGKANRYLALFFATTGDYTQAASRAYETLRVFEQIQDQRGVGQANELLGNIFLEQHDIERSKAKDFYETALTVYQKANLKKDVGHAYNSLGSFYARTADYEMAGEYHRKALAIRTEIGDEDGMSQSYLNLATVSTANKSYDEALLLFSKALPILQKLNNQYRMSVAYMNMGKLYTLTNQYDKAETYLLKSVAVAKSIHHKSLLYEVYYKLTVLEKKRGGYENALKYAQLESAYHDSLYTKEKAMQISDIETRFETAKKDQQIEVLQRDRQIQLIWRNIFISALILLTFLSVAIYSWRRYRDVKNRQILNIQIDTLVSQKNELSAKYKDVLTSKQDVSLISQDQKFLKKAIELVESKMSDPLFSVESMCDELAMSRTNLHRKIKAITGFPASEFIRTIRLRKAAMLLRNQTDAVSQIGFAVGFESHSYFSKAFKKHFGTSPSEYSQSADTSSVAR